MRVVGGNEVLFSGTFTAPSGSAAPANAEVILTYTNRSGATQVDTVTMTEASGVWSGTWDSSSAAAGDVEWVAYCWNGLKASTQGEFQIKRNGANTI